MFSFIRKRLPSKDRSHEGQGMKARPGETMQKSESEKDLHVDRTKKKKKTPKKGQSSLSIDELVCGPTVSPSNERINQSYSDVDYLPMMPRQVPEKRISQTSSQFSRSLLSLVHRQISLLDTLSDCYFNPSELLEDRRSPPSIHSKGPVIDIPVVFLGKEGERRNYKDIDHQRTRALNETAELRGVQRIISHPFRVNEHL